MIAQFNSDCGTCHDKILAGSDIYYTKKDGAHHWHCWENRPPSKEEFDLADRLGFLPADTNVILFPQKGKS